jgi:hypothetical protein
MSASNGQLMLNWGISTSAQLSSNTLTYNLRIGTTPGGAEIVSPLSDSNGLRRVVRLGNAGFPTRYSLNNIAPGNYYWSIQAIDGGFAGSAFAAEQSFVISPLLVAATFNTNHAIQLNITGNAGVAYHVFTSTNLVRWEYLGAATEFNSTSFSFVDGLCTNHPVRFYRVMGP